MKLATKLSSDIQKQLEDSIFIGRIATQDEIDRNTFNSTPIELSEHYDAVSFHIKCLSHIPECISRHFAHQHPFLTGTTFSSNNQRIFNEMINYSRLSYPEVKPKVEEMFKDKTVIFRLSPHHSYVNVELLKIESSEPSYTYIAIPAPDLKSSETSEDLRNKLIVEKRPITLRKYPSMFPSPEMIMYDGTIYKVNMESKSNATTYFQNEDTSVEVLTLSLDEMLDFVDIAFEHHLYFLSEEKYNQLKSILKDQSKVLKETAVTLSIDNPTINKVPTPPKIVSINNLTEYEFLKHLIHKARYEHKMFYRDEDLYSFHMSIKTNPLTVLGGMSGTGKSQLARIYGEALGLTEGKNMLFLPISPSYQEPNDILGYLNPVTGVFHESETGLVSLLLDAEKNPDHLYMVIFDEMNLSQVEHWFSPFLSLLENKGENYIQIYNENNKENSGHYQPKIKLGDNLIFIGTVNFDETTKSFSDRLLDRTNIITPEKAPFQDTIEFYKELSKHSLKELQPYVVSSTQLREQWKFNTSIGLDLLVEHEVYILDMLHQLINDIDPQKGVSFRVALSIVEFISNAPKDDHGEPLVSRRKLFDFQINQRILTKIKGIDTFARPLVGYIKNQNGQAEYIEGELASLFKSERAQLVSDFDRSLKTLKNKAKELMMYGFTN